MSSGPRTVVGAGIYWAGAAPKVGYPNESDGAMPICHVSIYLGIFSECHLSLLNYLRARRGMPLTDRLERCGGLFLD